MRHILLPTFFCVSLSALVQPAAANCTPPVLEVEKLDHVIAQLQVAETEAQAQALNAQLWEIWTTAPDPRAQEMLNRGMRRRAGYDFFGALEDFNALVAYCPQYAEGWNQRAFVHFLTQDFEAALGDLQRTLSLSPRHIGALSGQALTLLELSRTDEARQVLGQALALNPWLPERHLMSPGGALEPKGTDL